MLRIVPVYVAFVLFSIWLALIVGSSNALYNGVLAGGTLGGTIVLALASWYAIEQPILKLKRFVPTG